MAVYLERLYGRHLAVVAKHQLATGPFNAVLSSKLVLVLDEAMWPGLGMKALAKQREHLGIDPIRLREFPGRSGEVADLARIRHHQREPRRRECPDHETFVPARRFQHDQRRVQRTQTAHQLRDARLVVGHGPPVARGADGDDQLRVGHVDPDDNRREGHETCSCRRPCR